jgi:hypothetical protein
MTDKGMLVLQDCPHSQEDAPGSCTETCPTSSHNIFQTINIKVEEISDVEEEEEEDPLPISFPVVETEHKVRCFVSSLTDCRPSVAVLFTNRNSRCPMSDP